ncbi:hypothetical protein IWQ51_006863, partial [Labrenzia sp. EL_142]|nr:hypothetical protein [Labrenzia sp. EL_142]
FLTGDIWRENKAAMWLRELNTLFPKESLKELSFTVKWLNAGSMKRIKDLNTLFPKEPLSTLSDLSDTLKDKDMDRIKLQKRRLPQAPLQEILWT